LAACFVNIFSSTNGYLLSVELLFFRTFLSLFNTPANRVTKQNSGAICIFFLRAVLPNSVKVGRLSPLQNSVAICLLCNFLVRVCKPRLNKIERQTATTLCHTARSLKAYCSLAKGFAVTAQRVTQEARNKACCDRPGFVFASPRCRSCTMFGTAGRGRGIAKHPLWDLPVVFFFEAFPWIAGLEMQTAMTLCHTARGLKAYCSLAKGLAVTA